MNFVWKLDDDLAARIAAMIARGRRVKFRVTYADRIEVDDGGPASVLAFHPIITGKDGGGWRQFLDGRAIECGSTLELERFEWAERSHRDDEARLVSAGALEVRYEMDWQDVYTACAGERPRSRRIGVIYYDVGGYAFGPKEIEELPAGSNGGMRFRWPCRKDG